MQTQTADAVHDPDILEPQPGSLARRYYSTEVPVTLDQLAHLVDEGVKILEARTTILATARKRGIRLTSPEDWVLFKSPDERITGYLSDAGCERARDVWGIEIFDVSAPEKIASPDGQHFAKLIRGSGRSALTRQSVESMLGARSSDEDFCKDKVGVQREVLVEKAARANLDGNVARELMGMRNVPFEELRQAWEGTGKNVEHCRKGRGFGSQDERHGGARQGTPDVQPPTCKVCKDDQNQPLPLVYRAGKGTNKAFYGCRNWDKHKNVKVIVDAAEWEAQERKRTEQLAADARAQAAEVEDAKRQDAELAAREPGAEG